MLQETGFFDFPVAARDAFTAARGSRLHVFAAHGRAGTGWLVPDFPGIARMRSG